MQYTFKSQTLQQLQADGQIVMGAFEGDNELAIVDIANAVRPGLYMLVVVNHGGDECYLREECYFALSDAFDELRDFLAVEYEGV